VTRGKEERDVSGEMLGVNISALLDSLDTVAKETLEEPKESATRIRSQRKKTASSNPEEDAVGKDHGNDEEFFLDGTEGFSDHINTPRSPMPTGLSLDEGSSHTNRTQESYVIPNVSVTSNSSHGSDGLLLCFSNRVGGILL
jgi:hypothetical protein